MITNSKKQVLSGLIFTAFVICFPGLKVSPQSKVFSEEEVRKTIRNNNVRELKRKISQGLRPGTVLGPSENTPLILSAMKGRPELVHHLASMKGVDINKFNEEGLNPLITAISGGHLDVVKILLEQGAKIDIKPSSVNSKFDLAAPLVMATDLGYIEIVETLLDHGATVDFETPRGQTPFYLASCGNQVRVMEVLLEYGAEIENRDQYGWTPLACAVKNGSYGAVRFLLSKGADPNIITKERSYTPLIILARSAFYLSTTKHRKKSYRPEMDKNNNMNKKNEYEKIAWNLILNGAQVNISDNVGNTALHYYIQSGISSSTDLLLNYGANPFQNNKLGTSPLDLTVRSGNGERYEDILSKSQIWTVDYVPVRLHKQLIHAVESEDFERVGRLITLGASPNYESLHGWTPLLRAVANQNQPLIEFLIEKGGDPCRNNKWAVNAFDIGNGDLSKQFEFRCVFERYYYKKIFDSFGFDPLIDIKPYSVKIHSPTDWFLDFMG